MAPALSTRRIGDGVTLREALGGRWATHWLLWLAFFPGTMAIVLIRESATTYPEWWWPVLSGVIQHLAAGVVLVGGGHLARRHRPILPVATVAAIWAVSCLVRAVIGGTVADVVADAPADYLFRAVSWIVMTATWGPAIVYGIAQVGRRRALIGELESAQRALEESTARTAESGEEMRARLARTVQRSVAPVLDDLSTRLMAVQQDLDRAAFVEISMRLSSLHDETADLVESARAQDRSVPPAPRRATLREAFDVHLVRPWLTAIVVFAQTLAVVLPDGTRLFGAPAAIEIVLAVLLGSLALGATIQFCESRQLLRRARASSITLAAVGASVLAATWVMLHSGIDPITWHGAAILPTLGIALLGSCTTVVASLVLARANELEERTLAELLSGVRSSEEHQAVTLDRARHQLSELMHGPVQGRIAACVMALTFFSDADAPDGALASITEQVLDHLAAASHDLSLLAEGRPPNGGA